MKCPNCGYEDPFHNSWYDPNKEVAEPTWVNEYFPFLYDLLQEEGGDVIYEGYVYHATRNFTTIERMPLELSIQIGLHGRPPQERAHRKNPHLKAKIINVVEKK